MIAMWCVIGASVGCNVVLVLWLSEQKKTLTANQQTLDAHQRTVNAHTASLTFQSATLVAHQRHLDALIVATRNGKTS